MPFPLPPPRRLVALLTVILMGLGGGFGSFTLAEQTRAPATAASPTVRPSAADFAAAAEEVLAQMSEITGLALRSPLKKSLRSREQIRAHVIQEMNEDKNTAERYASARSAEAFGLLPKGFDLDSFLTHLLPHHIPALYAPQPHHFYL